MLQLPPDGGGRLVTLGSDILDGQQPQVVVEAGTWQGAFVRESADFALVGCTVSPGFEFADYQRADRDQLIRLYPDMADLIVRLTWRPGVFFLILRFNSGMRKRIMDICYLDVNNDDFQAP